MWGQSLVQISTKLSEIILQTRLEVKKALLDHFKQILKSHKNHPNKHLSNNHLHFLNTLLPKQLYQVKQKIKKTQAGHSSAPVQLQIVFQLCDRASGQKYLAQSWLLQIKVKEPVSQGSLKEIVSFFTQIILLLNKLPLFSIYHKQKTMKAKYMLDYKIIYNQKFSKTSIIDLKGKDFIHRRNQEIDLKVIASYMPSFQCLWKPQPLIQQANDRKDSIVTSDYGAQRKVSIFEFYDPDLQFTFLSTQQQNFGKTEMISEQIMLNVDQGSGQFELMYMSEDEDFLAENKDFFNEFSKLQQDYF